MEINDTQDVILLFRKKHSMMSNCFSVSYLFYFKKICTCISYTGTNYSTRKSIYNPIYKWFLTWWIKSLKITFWFWFNFLSNNIKKSPILEIHQIYHNRLLNNLFQRAHFLFNGVGRGFEKENIRNIFHHSQIRSQYFILILIRWNFRIRPYCR